MSEKNELLQLTKYIKYQYPDLIYRVDIAADTKLTIGQAKQNKAIQMSKRGYPDIFIPKARIIDGMLVYGLYLELKASGTILYNKDGSLRKNEHLADQDAMHKRLRKENYCVFFTIGFNDAKDIIDWWLE